MAEAKSDISSEVASVRADVGQYVTHFPMLFNKVLVNGWLLILCVCQRGNLFLAPALRHQVRHRHAAPVRRGERLPQVPAGGDLYAPGRACGPLARYAPRTAPLESEGSTPHPGDPLDGARLRCHLVVRNEGSHELQPSGYLKGTAQQRFCLGGPERVLAGSCKCAVALKNWCLVLSLMVHQVFAGLPTGPARSWSCERLL